jgi:hypothetical protein
VSAVVLLMILADRKLRTAPNRSKKEPSIGRRRRLHGWAWRGVG